MVRGAGFPSIKSMDDYDFSIVTFPPSWARRRAVLQFIEQKHSLIFWHLWLAKPCFRWRWASLRATRATK